MGRKQASSAECTSGLSDFEQQQSRTISARSNLRGSIEPKATRSCEKQYKYSVDQNRSQTTLEHRGSGDYDADGTDDDDD